MPKGDPRAVEAARRRWGPERVVRLDSLAPPYRAAVLALVDAARKEAATVSETSVAAIREGGDRDANPAA